MCHSDQKTIENVNSARRSRNRYVELFRVGKTYRNAYGEASPVVDDVNLIIDQGEIVSLIGHSGCGKSTLLTMLAGLTEISSGSIAVAGREIDGPGPDRAVVFQSPCLLPWMTALQNVQLGVDQVYAHATRAQRRDLCEYYLSAVGLEDASHRFPGEMSGGMQQRVGIARAIALKPTLSLLDEPFGRLDSLTRMELQDTLLQVLDREQITTVLVTHDVDEAIYMSNRVCMMTSGPKANIGQVLDLPFESPRDRSAVLNHPLYYDFRGCLVSFLELQHRSSESATERDCVNHTRRKFDVMTKASVIESPTEADGRFILPTILCDGRRESLSGVSS